MLALRTAVLAFAALLLLGGSDAALANSGPPIPVPAMNAAEAAAKAKAAFTVAVDPIDAASQAEFFVVSVRYVTGLQGWAPGEYAWVVVLLHPIRNSRRYIFKVGADGIAVLLYATL